jgi:hypothetical protein
MKAKVLTFAGLCALAVALAVPASGAPVNVYPFHGSESNPSFQICGLDLNADFSFTGVFVVKASGVSLYPNEFRSVWTNPATGKSIVIQAGNLGVLGPPIDNGDGTVSFISSGSGNYIVKDAHGAPISLDAGRVVARVTFDAATGAFISVEFLGINGNESDTPADSSCESIVAALT